VEAWEIGRRCYSFGTDAGLLLVAYYEADTSVTRRVVHEETKIGRSWTLAKFSVDHLKRLGEARLRPAGMWRQWRRACRPTAPTCITLCTIFWTLSLGRLEIQHFSKFDRND